MTLIVLFNFSAADKRDPMSGDDCELLDIKLDGVTLPLKVENDPMLNGLLERAIYRLHDIMPK